MKLLCKFAKFIIQKYNLSILEYPIVKSFVAKPYDKFVGGLKLKLSSKEEMEFFDLYDNVKTEYNQLNNKIKEQSTLIDKIVYELYHLNPGEMEIIENKYPNK